MTTTTIPSVRGLPLPNLEAHGLHKKMKPAARLIEEQDRLRRRAEELGHEQQQLREQIKQGEYEYTQAWGRAMRSGEETPDDEPIKQARVRLEEVRKEIGAVRHAGELADAELNQVVAEHAAEWDAEVQAKAERLLAEAQQMADALTAKLAETEGLVGVHGWLTRGGQVYSPLTPATVSIDAILHERRRALGLLEMEVLG